MAKQQVPSKTASKSTPDTATKGGGVKTKVTTDSLKPGIASKK